MNFIPSLTPTIEIYDEDIQRAGIKLFVKRLDLIHPVISGNKWYKLKYNIEQAQRENKKYILTFGGAYSNHLAATAAATKIYGISSVAIVRGEEPQVLNPVLTFCKQHQMELKFVSRELYRNKNNPHIIDEITKEFNNAYIIPEGGSNTEGVKGCIEILPDEDKKFDFIFCACGTATTFAGLILSCKNSSTVLKGISVLKGMKGMADQVEKFISFFDTSTYNNWEIIHDYHFGGYAKKTPLLESFINDFIIKHNIFIEPIYTGKVFFAVYDMIKQKKIPSGARILVIHTGGFRG